VTFTNFSPIKLTQDTYPIWLPQVVPHLKGGNLYGYVDGTLKCPPETITTITDGVETTSLNPTYLHWYMQDQLILGAITFALSNKMISHVTRCTTYMEAWTTLKNLFSAQSKARSMQVHFQLNTLKKGNSSIADYYHKFQALTDTLSSIGQPLTDVQMQTFLLRDLGSEYDPFVTFVTTQIEPLSVEEIYGHLLSHEMSLEQHQIQLTYRLLELMLLIVTIPHVVVVENATTSVDSNLGHHHVCFEAGGVDPHMVHLQTVAPQPITLSRSLTARSSRYVIEWVILHLTIIIDSIRHIPEIFQKISPIGHYMHTTPLLPMEWTLLGTLTPVLPVISIQTLTI
jgi:hypothetical protein